jgi:tRNA (guanine-N7-)-methyltransferase
MTDPKNRTHRFHGRRKGKALTSYRKSLIDNELSRYTPQPITDLSTSRWLEIGFGNGEFLSHMCQNNPDIYFIGCEPFVNGVSALLASLDKPVDNLGIWNDDARILMDGLPDQSIDRVYLLNPDPWPKTRHAKRRFVQQSTLDSIARILKSNGLFIMSTDVAPLAEWMFNETQKHPSFTWMDKTNKDKLNPPSDWPIDKTRYMKKALGGEDIYWLKFRRSE